jgi:hypothetical protein
MSASQAATSALPKTVAPLVLCRRAFDDEAADRLRVALQRVVSTEAFVSADHGFFSKGGSMRFVKPLGKSAKFTAVTMPLSIFGWQLNKRLFAWVRALWAGSINPTCPDCDSGILLAQTDAPAILDQPVKATDKPRPSIHGPATTAASRCWRGSTTSTSARWHVVTASAALVLRSATWRCKSAKPSRQASHGVAHLLGTSAAMLVGGIYMLASGTPLMIALPWLSFSGMFWVFGMTRSYRVLAGHDRASVRRRRSAPLVQPRKVACLREDHHAAVHRARCRHGDR